MTMTGICYWGALQHFETTILDLIVKMFFESFSTVSLYYDIINW